MQWDILLLVLYLLILNVLGFALMGIDKRRAKRFSWRIPESTLFLAALLGGSVGAILGMKIFRHKTRHKKFKFGLPAILCLQVVAVALCFIVF